LNENNVTLSFPDEKFAQIITHEREIRTGYFIKRKKIQKKLRTGKKRKQLLKKYGEREKNRLDDLTISWLTKSRDGREMWWHRIGGLD